MKKLDQLTEAEFNKLKDTGLLNTIYPDAPDKWIDIKGKRPLPKFLIDLKKIIAITENHMDEIATGNEVDDTYLVDDLLKIVYGQNVFEWINKQRD